MAFIILALLTGPFAVFVYVLGCREPLRGTHEAYVSARWRQVLGSTMRCAAGAGLGIMAGAAVATHWRLSAWVDLSLESLLGFGFGWAVFQAFAMRGMAGGSYLRSLRRTFLPEFLSMNLLMAGMVVTMRALMPHIDGSADPLAGEFWFVMSMAFIADFILAYPINWWLVVNGLKHGMITVRSTSRSMQHPALLTTTRAITPEILASRLSVTPNSAPRKRDPSIHPSDQSEAEPEIRTAVIQALEHLTLQRPARVEGFEIAEADFPRVLRTRNACTPSFDRGVDTPRAE